MWGWETSLLVYWRYLLIAKLENKSIDLLVVIVWWYSGNANNNKFLSIIPTVQLWWTSRHVSGQWSQFAFID